jgi:uncharacterized protein with HEPN domain
MRAYPERGNLRIKERDYGSYLEDIIEHMNYAEEFIKDATFEEFANDKKTILSVTKCIEIVGEATKCQWRCKKCSIIAE